MTNMNLENGMKKLRRKDLLDEALELALEAYKMYGPSDTITAADLLRLMDQLEYVRTPDMTVEEWNAIRRWYLKRALGGKDDE